MTAHDDHTAPSRTGIRRIFPAWEYRHLRAWAGARIAGGIVTVGLGLVTLVAGSFSAAAVGWAAVFLVGGVLALAAGFWELTIARSVLPRA
jgi:hypothetical protein